MTVDRIPLPADRRGSLWLTSLADVSADPDAVLADLGAGTIVCLNPESELVRRAPDYIVWLRSNQPHRALWFPIRDVAAESADATMPFVEMVVERLPAGVVMHCALGQGRAGTMAVVVLLALGVAREEAVATVAAHRADAGPAGPSQWALVDDVAARVAG